MPGPGGKREGAGRKLGASTTKTREAADRLMSDGGKIPLEYMFEVFRDENADPSRRDDMAKAAAPFCHAKLASVEVGGHDGGPIQVSITSDDAGLL